jgi:hypothetical protein
LTPLLQLEGVRETHELFGAHVGKNSSTGVLAGSPSSHGPGPGRFGAAFEVLSSGYMSWSCMWSEVACVCATVYLYITVSPPCISFTHFHSIEHLTGCFVFTSLFSINHTRIYKPHSPPFSHKYTPLLHIFIMVRQSRATSSATVKHAEQYSS